jgi:hypothetical protein
MLAIKFGDVAPMSVVGHELCLLRIESRYARKNRRTLDFKEETVLSNQDTTSNLVWGDKVGRLKKVKDRLKK